MQLREIFIEAADILSNPWVRQDPKLTKLITLLLKEKLINHNTEPPTYSRFFTSLTNLAVGDNGWAFFRLDGNYNLSIIACVDAGQIVRKTIESVRDTEYELEQVLTGQLAFLELNKGPVSSRVARNIKARVKNVKKEYNIREDSFAMRIIDFELEKFKTDLDQTGDPAADAVFDEPEFTNAKAFVNATNENYIKFKLVSDISDRITLPAFKQNLEAPRQYTDRMCLYALEHSTKLFYQSLRLAVRIVLMGRKNEIA